MLMSQIFLWISGIILEFPWRQKKKPVHGMKPPTENLALKVSLWEPGGKSPWISSLHTSLLPSSINTKWCHKSLQSVSNNKWKRHVPLPHILHSFFSLITEVSPWRSESPVVLLDKRLFSEIFLRRFWLKFIRWLKYIDIYTHTMLKHPNSLENSHSLRIKSFSFLFFPFLLSQNDSWQDRLGGNLLVLLLSSSFPCCVPPKDCASPASLDGMHLSMDGKHLPDQPRSGTFCWYPDVPQRLTGAWGTPCTPFPASLIHSQHWQKIPLNPHLPSDCSAQPLLPLHTTQLSAGEPEHMMKRK